jgi:hypothetical protein
MRHLIIGLWMLCCAVTSAIAQVSIGIGLPGVSIGINLPIFPELVPVPGYPVYYAPRLSANFFFYDGVYWVYQGDNWYASSWYNGPWALVGPQFVPVFVLRIPVRYYRVPPPYFHGWRADAPPRWNEHWGRDWEQQRKGWNQWDRRYAPAPAPLPTYQRQYSGDRYPQQFEQQQQLRTQHYRYQPRDPVVRQHYQAPPARSQHGQSPPPHDRSSKPQDVQRSSPPQQADRDAQRSAPAQQKPAQGQGKDRDQGEGRGHEGKHP